MAAGWTPSSWSAVPLRMSRRATKSCEIQKRTLHLDDAESFFVLLIYQQAGLPLFAIDFHAAVYHSTGVGALEHALHHSAVLICQTDDNGLTAGGYMTEG